MEKTKVSDKYQIVIPKAIRNKLHIKEGQILNIYALDDGGMCLTPEKKWPDDYLGIGKDIWKNINVAEYIKEERDGWK